ncbi:DUF6152 family protein [Deinococcus sp. YIM 134068]|uniref:DUF6152 family protein n=1 Tax=Deinococcus lichenicola TaxID=3118910 RepID=UPI002F91C938
MSDAQPLPPVGRSLRPPALRPLAARVLASLLLAGLASAHHGWSEYDANRTLDLTGVVRAVGYENPHVTVRLEVGTPARTWVAILAPPARMGSRGIPDGMLRPGLTVRVVGYPHRTEANELRAEQIYLPFELR